MPTASKWQEENSKPGLTHSKIYWLQRTYVGIGKKDGSLAIGPRTIRVSAMPCQPSVGSPLPSLTCCATFPLAKFQGCSRSPEDERLVGAGDAMDVMTAGRTKHKSKILDTGNGHQLHRLSPHLSWNLQTDLISGHKPWGWPKTGMRSQEETLVSVTGLQSWKELEGSPQPKHSSGRSGNWGLRKARPHGRLHNGLFKRKGHILVFLLLLITLLLFSKTLPGSGSLPAPANHSATPIMLDPSVLKGVATLPGISAGSAVSFCWPFSLPEIPFLPCSFLLHPSQSQPG